MHIKAGLSGPAYLAVFLGHADMGGGGGAGDKGLHTP